ncbi:MAG: PP2C family protein-serine/threonine phosphatase [Acidobacteriota bacterium]
MDQLILMSEDEATRTYFDSRNARILFRLLWLFAFGALIETLVAFFTNQGSAGSSGGHFDRYVLIGQSVVSLLVIRWLFFVRERSILIRHFRPILLTYLTFQFLLFRYHTLGAGLQPADFLLPWLVLLFRLPTSGALIPIGALWVASTGRNVVTTVLTELDPEFWPVLVQTAISIVVLLWGKRLNERLYVSFLDDWRREHRRHRERSRMREELDDARKTQLSMLPPGDPKIPWLDVAGISIPASEVGGDYYDYFTVSDSQQTVVVADVAGHGVASALLLSGIRSCLYLLNESPQAPAETLTKLDRMVRKTSSSRLFVTMLYVLFDCERKQLTYSIAGHPPLLHYSAESDEVEELGLVALPLGTALGNSLVEKSERFARNDVFLLYTDGIAETMNSRRDLYGNQRLVQRFRDCARDRTAKEIRDTLLGDVWNFKGDSEQTDDITIVVVKIY